MGRRPSLFSQKSLKAMSKHPIRFCIALICNSIVWIGVGIFFVCEIYPSASVFPFILGIISFIIAIILFISYNSKKKKKSNTIYTITVKNKEPNTPSTPIQAFGPTPLISEYFACLNKINSLYRERDTDPFALQDCIDVCYYSINIFPKVLADMNYVPLKSIPAFERLAIILENNEQYKDALEIAQLQEFFVHSDKNTNRVNRLLNKSQKNEDAKSTGNTQLKYHYSDIKDLNVNTLWQNIAPIK